LIGSIVGSKGLSPTKSLHGRWLGIASLVRGLLMAAQLAIPEKQGLLWKEACIAHNPLGLFRLAHAAHPCLSTGLEPTMRSAFACGLQL
jgi:hypothetical protein